MADADLVVEQAVPEQQPGGADDQGHHGGHQAAQATCRCHPGVIKLESPRPSKRGLRALCTLNVSDHL